MIVEFEEIDIASCLGDCVVPSEKSKQMYETLCNLVNIELMTKCLQQHLYISTAFITLWNIYSGKQY